MAVLVACRCLSFRWARFRLNFCLRTPACRRLPTGLLTHKAGSPSMGFLRSLEGLEYKGCDDLYLEVPGTYQPIITVLLTLLIIPLKGLIGVIPIISRVISTVISGY